MHNNLLTKKTLLMGLSNSGKTSIIHYLKGIRNLSAFCEIKPTKDVDFINYQAMDCDHSVWDFGGQESYIDRFLTEFYKFMKGADEILFVIDVQDKEKFKPALDYLKKIIDLLVKRDAYDIVFVIYLHKYDPDLSESHPDITDETIKKLTNKIKDLFPNNFKIKILKSSICVAFNEITVS